MTLTFGLRMRVLVIALVLAGAAAGLMVFKRMQSSTDSSATSPPGPSTPTHTSAARARTTPAVAKQTHKQKAKPVAPAARPRPAPTKTSPDTLPTGIQQALSANHVVVVALYDPRAKIDDTALQEASAGARLAGTTFVPVNVTTNEVDSLNARYGVIQDPAVLVLRPPGDLVVRIDGFADRDTVAQAAVNAAS